MTSRRSAATSVPPHLTKPVDQRELLAAIARVPRTSPQHAAAVGDAADRAAGAPAPGAAAKTTSSTSGSRRPARTARAQVVIAANGAEAVDAIRRQPFDVVLMDADAGDGRFRDRGDSRLGRGRARRLSR
jgi:CheY-like chemotaxis protein